MPGVVHALALLPNGTLYAAGRGERSPLTPGDTANTVARWDGHAWASCGPGGLPSATIYALAATTDGQLYAAGQLEDSVGARLRLLRWNGRRWRRLGRAQPDFATCTVRALAVLPTGEVYVGGQFAESMQLPGTHFLARWKGRRWAYLREAGEPAKLAERPKR
jgi:alpha-tubulin suppressor-like RCC1 family protein